MLTLLTVELSPASTELLILLVAFEKLYLASEILPSSAPLSLLLIELEPPSPELPSQ